MNDNYVSIKEAADILDVHWQTVRNYIKSGKLPYFKLGRAYRIRESDILQLTRTFGDTRKEPKREIELRYTYQNRERIEENLRELGAKITNHSHIIDHWFCDVNINSVEENNEDYESSKGYIIRIREVDNDYSGRIVTTLEVKKLADGKNHGNMIEHEVVVGDYHEAKNLLQLMNKKEFLIIDKERFVYKWKDFKFCFDEIRGWGEGIEIELMTENSYEKAKRRIEKIAKEIGLKRKNKVKASLTYLALKKLSKF